LVFLQILTNSGKPKHRQATAIPAAYEDEGGRSVTIDGRSPSPGAFWVLLKRSIPKLDPDGKDIIQRESLGTGILSELH